MFPKMCLIRQWSGLSEEVINISEVLYESLADIKLNRINLNKKKIGVAVGSRGIDRLPEIVKEVVDFIKSRGGQPFVFAAMGSHGNCSEDGQREVLKALGITEKSLGVKVETCAKNILYGYTDSGIPVYANPIAFRYDMVIPVNRIKMHTDFDDITESGILKMLAVGIGNPIGCKTIHRYALQYGYGGVIRECASFLMKKLEIAFGVMITENWQHKVDHIEAVKPEDFLKRESLLLNLVKQQALKLPYDKIDLLIIDEIGKNISGAGMDTKVIGRLGIIGQKEPVSPRIKRIFVRDITDESDGNACGIGLADFAKKNVLKKINIDATAVNSCSANTPEAARIPCLMNDDYSAIEAALNTVGLENISKAYIIHIKNTNLLGEMEVSETLYNDILKKMDSIELISGPYYWSFDESNMLCSRL